MDIEKEIKQENTSSGKKALIAMSGGVDSSVAAALMTKKGYDCMGVMMKLYENEDIGIKKENTCCSAEDAEDAAGVARKLGIPFYVFNFTEDFRCKVMDRFVDSYLKGETPNPCIDCNRYMKFEHLYERGRTLGCDKIVTGHYVRISFNEESGRWELKKALDDTKDQSYVLYNLTQEQLSHTDFPLGEYRKTEIRDMAEEYGFFNARKHDSQDICFVPDGDYAHFIEEYTEKKVGRGNFVDEEGNVLGPHKGIVHYTIGQRKGLGLPSTEPWFVKEIHPDTGDVVLCRNDALFTTTLLAEEMNWVSMGEPAVGAAFRCLAKIRYKHKEQWATATLLEDGRLRVVFDEPQRAITKGQAVVLYNGDLLLAGGRISAT